MGKSEGQRREMRKRGEGANLGVWGKG